MTLRLFDIEYFIAFIASNPALMCIYACIPKFKTTKGRIWTRAYIARRVFHTQFHTPTYRRSFPSNPQQNKACSPISPRGVLVTIESC